LRATAQNAKCQGELVEVAFLHKAVSLGFAAAKPYGDSESYDFILDARQSPGGRLWRVQVKSTTYKRHDAYHIFAGHFTTRTTKKNYTAKQIDFLVAYVVPEEAWYVLPVLEFTPKRYLRVYPHRQISRGHYENFRDASHLMSDSRARQETSHPFVTSKSLSSV
jgi:hypothetical protein